MTLNPSTGKDGDDDFSRLRTEFFNLNHTDFLLKVNPDERDSYEKFCDARISTMSVRMMMTVIACSNVYVFAMSLVYAKHRVFLAVSAGLLIVLRNPFALFLMTMKTLARNGSNHWLVVGCIPWFPFLTKVCAIFGTLAMGLFLIARVANGKCESLDQLHMYGCNSEYASHALPQELLYCLMTLPVAYSVVFKAVSPVFVFVSWFIGVVCICIAIGIANAYVSIPLVVVYCPVSLILLYEIHRQNIMLFKLSRRQQFILDANRRVSEESQNELRFMVANMAHDLKTPLSAFMNGVETLSSLFSDIKKDGNTTAEEDQVLNTTIKENIKNLFNVNNFMTMTVNRCIDYMKASKGIKLEPRLETINLQEVLSMPLNCMRDLQSRIAIIQKAIPSSVCSHIITDLQWFQENLFCLISNAVKYSSHGHITVSVSLCGELHPFVVAAKRKKEVTRLDELEAMQRTMSDSNEAQQNPLSGLPPELQKSTASSPNVSPKNRTRGSEIGIGGNFTDLNALEQGLGATVRDTGGFGAKMVSLSTKSNDSGKTQLFRATFNISPLRFGKNKVYVNNTDVDEGPPTPNANANAATLGDETTETFLLVEVEDTGIGLSDEVKETLFTPFKQAQRRAGGTGLGLYSLAKRVDALGGYYGVSNRRDGEQGSIFWFAIPYRPDLTSGSNSEPVASFRSLRSSIARIDTSSSGGDGPTHRLRSMSSNVSSPSSVSKPKPKSPSAPAPGKLRVLLVDDSITVLKMTSNLLKRHGHVVDQEENGADALARLEKTRSREYAAYYDVMLIDLNMPVMDGLEATKRLREVERQLNAASAGTITYHQKVFAFSANNDNATLLEAMEAGADDFITKPFSIQTFNEKCEKMIANIESNENTTSGPNSPKNEQTQK